MLQVSAEVLGRVVSGNHAHTERVFQMTSARPELARKPDAMIPCKTLLYFEFLLIRYRLLPISCSSLGGTDS